MSTSARVGFIGLGNIGLPMACNVARGGFQVLGFDVTDKSRWAKPPISPADSLIDVAQSTELVLLSLPDASAVHKVLSQMISASSRSLRKVIDLSTIGVAAARELAGTASAADIAYIDAPVSGGVAGARERKLSVMCACPKQQFEQVKPVFDSFSQQVFHIGEVPGQGQALKLLNNFLSATALVATSEAMLFGLANGLEMTTMVDVLKVSSGRNSAVDDKFPNYVVRNRYESGFRNTLMTKDVNLYVREAQGAGCLGAVGGLVSDVWSEFTRTSPDEDFTKVFEFVGRSLGERLK